jgi:transposase, IS30 family
MGLASAMSIAWEAEVAAGPGRHHLRVAVDTEAGFWAVYGTGGGADAAASAAGVGRSTVYRWLDRRFFELRAAGFTAKRAQRLLWLSGQVTARAERQRATAKLRERQAAMSAHEAALRSSRQYADRTAGVPSKKQQQRAELVDTYWQLMRSGETNTSACRLLGMSRRSGTTIRRAHHYQAIPPGESSPHGRRAARCHRILPAPSWPSSRWAGHPGRRTVCVPTAWVFLRVRPRSSAVCRPPCAYRSRTA